MWSYKHLLPNFHQAIILATHQCLDMNVLIYSFQSSIRFLNNWHLETLWTLVTHVYNMCWWTGLSLVHVMACCLCGAWQSLELMMADCEVVLWEQTSIKLESKYICFHTRKCTLDITILWHCKMLPFISGISVLKVLLQQPPFVLPFFPIHHEHGSNKVASFLAPLNIKMCWIMIPWFEI